MCARQQLARRLAAQDVGAARRIDAVGRVRLAALELADADRPGEAGDLLAHPTFEPRFVETKTLRNVLGTRIGLRPIHICASSSEPAPRTRVGISMPRL